MRYYGCLQDVSKDILDKEMRSSVLKSVLPSMMLSLLLLLCVSCGGSGDGTYPVSGTLELANGDPFSEGQVQFLSSHGKSHMVTLKADGSFELRKNAKANGLEPGEYKVLAFEANFGDIDRPAKKVIHPKYGNAQSTDLTATVKEESNVFEFTLDPFEGR